MADEFSFPGYKLPVNPAWERGTVAQGFVTPSQDRIPQVMSIPPPLLEALDEETFLAAVKGVWFPVHAMGYNWLQGNRRSGTVVANRITELMKNDESQGFHCEKVILVTHSMGGLVARAVVHPNMGKLNEKVLGIVHGVMPAIGAGAAYKRMRCGVEGDDTAAKVVGNEGTLIMAVLGNAQGGLELLPSQAYGNNWLQVRHKGGIIKSLPIKGDPYEEIYKLKGVWFGLLNEKSLKGRSWRNRRGTAVHTHASKPFVADLASSAPGKDMKWWRASPPIRQIPTPMNSAFKAWVQSTIRSSQDWTCAWIPASRITVPQESGRV